MTSGRFFMDQLIVCAIIFYFSSQGKQGGMQGMSFNNIKDITLN